jgi:hypothetical protein
LRDFTGIHGVFPKAARISSDATRQKIRRCAIDFPATSHAYAREKYFIASSAAEYRCAADNKRLLNQHVHCSRAYVSAITAS